MNLKVYAGIGSRRTPDDVILLMEQIGEIFATQGWTLRSGGATGADTAFEVGALRGATDSAEALRRSESGHPVTEIYLPWPNFNEHSSPRVHIPPAAFAIAKELHPNWARCTSPVRRLHARNVQQVLGPDPAFPERSRFVCCWTHGGDSVGGSGMTIAVAQKYHVPVWNMGAPGVMAGLQKWVDAQTNRSDG